MNKIKFLLPIYCLFLNACQETNTISKDYAQINSKELSKNNFQEKDYYQEPSVAVFCPIEGSAKTTHLKELNILKNRTKLSSENGYDTRVTLSAMLNKGDDTHRWSNNSFVKVIGYVKDVKVGGVETVNCKAKDKDLRDTHIELSLNPLGEDKRENVIAEITPRVRQIMAKQGIDWRTSTIRSKYLGRWVEIEGWLFFDTEHDNMAENTKPGNIKNWRATAWEIHPITKIKIVDKH